jgi:two-component system response regulator DegU
MTQRRPHGEGSASPGQDDAQNRALHADEIPARTRVLVADPIDLARQGLCGLLAAQRDLEIVASCRTVDDAVYESLACAPEVALIGYGFEEQERLDAVRQISRSQSSLPVIVISDRPDLDTFLACVRVGARGYLGGNVDAAALAEAVRTLSAGGCTIEPSILDDLFAYLSRISASSGWATSSPNRNSALGRLSRREREVLRLMAQGMGNKEIASRLRITPGTTKTHLRHIFRKLHVSDRTGAVLAALEIDPQRLLPAA